MRKKILFLLCLVIAGILSYYSGYYLYISSNPRTEIVEPVNLHRAMMISEDISEGLQEYYIAKIEQDMLVIYKMPERTFYDSVKVSSLHLEEKDKNELLAGQRFASIEEVFEFLENTMS